MKYGVLNKTGSASSKKSIYTLDQMDPALLPQGEVLLALSTHSKGALVLEETSKDYRCYAKQGLILTQEVGCWIQWSL